MPFCLEAFQVWLCREAPVTCKHEFILSFFTQFDCNRIHCVQLSRSLLWDLMFWEQCCSRLKSFGIWRHVSRYSSTFSEVPATSIIRAHETSLITVAETSSEASVGQHTCHTACWHSLEDHYFSHPPLWQYHLIQITSFLHWYIKISYINFNVSTCNVDKIILAIIWKKCEHYKSAFMTYKS
jgi:hypothetical protein